MRQAPAFLPGMLLILAATLSSDTQNVALPDSPEDSNIFYYNARGPLELHCKDVASGGAAITWTKNGKPVEKVSALNGRVEFLNGGTILKIKGRSTEDDYGKYTCSAGSASRSWEVRGRPRAKLPSNSFVSEGDSIKITCKLIGKPYPAVRWLYSSKSEKATKDTPEAQAVLGNRVVLAKSEQGIEGAQLTIGPAKLTDEGWFTCMPVGEGVPAATRLRVKDRYAALWPFLGICAEVCIVCIIILWYEKRTKKPVLDDDDTEQEEEKK